MKKLLGILVLCLLLSVNAYADSKFDKDLKKISKNNGFVDTKGKVYSKDQITDKKNTILIIYNHGSDYDQVTDKCTSPSNNVPRVIRYLHNKKIRNFNIKIYRLCTGAKGWSKKEQTKMWKAHEKSGKLAIELKDKDGTPLINKQKQNQRRRVIKKKVDSFIEEGFENIILAGHSSGGWQSIKIKAEFPELAKGVIGLHPGAGGTVKNRKDWPWWEDVRYYGFVEDLSKLNAFIITHDKDEYNSPKDYSSFSNLNSVKFLNLTQSGCKKAEPSKTYHGIAL
ncbi:alpha/beta hydrolase, partial [bacterium]|nr:alpha/beta hydrolase [bacterium]